MGAIELQRLSQAVPERDTWLPADGLLELRRIGIEAADVDPLLVRRPVDVTHTAAARSLEEQADQVAMGDRLAAAAGENVTVAGVRRACPKECIRGVVHIDEIAHLRPVAEDLNLLVLERKPDEPADEAL